MHLGKDEDASDKSDDADAPPEGELDAVPLEVALDEPVNSPEISHANVPPLIGCKSSPFKLMKYPSGVRFV